MKTSRIMISLLCGAMLAACSSSTAPVETPPTPTHLQSAVTNQYYPLTPGTLTVFHTQNADGLEIDSLRVASVTKVINGFDATEVHDIVYLNGSVIEDTYDWFAQDSAGNVWYLGEDTKQYDSGVVVGTAGTWQWGVQGATPGVVMWGDPAARVGKVYRQEFFKGHAEDLGKVITVGETVTVAYGTLTGCVKTEEWNTLEPLQLHDNKFYCPSVGTALEVAGGTHDRTELFSKTP